MARWGWVAAGVVVAGLAGGGWLQWRAWQADLPPLPAPGHAESVAVNVLGNGSTLGTPVPASDLAFPRWRMELRRLFVRRGDHVRTWLVAARVSGLLPGMAMSAAPETADVWVIGVEGWCREMGPVYLGPGQPPPIPPKAMCWEDLIYHGDTGQMWWGLDMGFSLH